MIITIITFIIVLSILVFVHELGHFWTARRFGVKAEEFGFGFPPRILGIYKNLDGKWKVKKGKEDILDAQDTIYSINWLPLGGFVKIKGENGDSNDPDSFMSKKIWQRAIILSAGVIMNIILAAFLFCIGLMIGLPQVLDNVPSGAKINDKKIQIVQIIPETPAAKAGLKLGDVIDSINGEKFSTYIDLQNYVAERVGQNLTYNIKRIDKELTFNITPEIMKETGKGGIGIGIAETGIVKYNFILAITEGFKITFLLTKEIIIAFYELFKNLFLGKGLSADIAGPVGIASMTGQAARMGISYTIQFAAMLSINLAIINFLPFPALDGGRVLFLVVEKIKGSPIKREIEAVTHSIGFALLLVLVIIVTFRDIAKFSGIMNNLFNKLF